MRFVLDTARPELASELRRMLGNLALEDAVATGRKIRRCR
jgi:hypothetical protein